MSKIDLLKKINRAMSPNKIDFSGVDNEINALKKKLEETVNIQTVDDVKFQLDKFKKKVDLTPLIQEIEKIGQVFEGKSKELQSQIDEKTKELEVTRKSVVENEVGGSTKITLLTREIKALRTDLTQLEVVHEADLQTINQSIADVRTIEGRINKTISTLSEGLNVYSTKKDAEKILKDLQDTIDELRRDLLNKMSNIGGGNMNREIFIGNANPLTKYTDINFKAGTNVTISYANNNATKKVDVTITATGTGGSVRSINSVDDTTAAGDTAGTDYVYLCNGTFTLTMPTAVGNSNLYTIKNVGTGVITVDTTSSETIDGDLTITMPLQYTAVDLISDTANWNIT